MSTDTALVVIDVQVGLIEEAYRCNEVLDSINTLLSKARATGTPVIYIQHDGPLGHGLEVGTSAWEIHPAIAPQDFESPTTFLDNKRINIHGRTDGQSQNTQ